MKAMYLVSCLDQASLILTSQVCMYLVVLFAMNMLNHVFKNSHTLTRFGHLEVKVRYQIKCKSIKVGSQTC